MVQIPRENFYKGLPSCGNTPLETFKLGSCSQRVGIQLPTIFSDPHIRYPQFYYSNYYKQVGSKIVLMELLHIPYQIHRNSHLETRS